MPLSNAQANAAHQFHRHPGTPWAELRVTRHSPHCYRLHMHAEYSIGIVDAGQALFQHAGGPERIGAGSVVLIEPGRWHACNPDQVTHWSYRMLFVQADWVHSQLGVDGLLFPARALHSAEVSHQVNALCQPLTSSGHSQAFEEQLLNLLRQHAQPAEPSSANPMSQASNAVATALQQLHQHPDAAPSVQELAEAGGMSASRFIRSFKAATGVTPGAYHLNLRLNGARRLLAQGMALAEAAHSMGFADQAHMQRSFKAYHATTPGTYLHAMP